MPKLKTHRGSAKRFKFTGKGKVMHKRSAARHLLSKKSARFNMAKRRKGTVAKVNLSSIRRLLPYA